MSRFQISYWAHDAAWRPFAAPVEADSARAAIEKVNPRAAGGYRVTSLDTKETEGLFWIALSARDECELVEVALHPRDSSRFRVM